MEGIKINTMSQFQIIQKVSKTTFHSLFSISCEIEIQTVFDTPHIIITRTCVIILLVVVTNFLSLYAPTFFSFLLYSANIWRFPNEFYIQSPRTDGISWTKENEKATSGKTKTEKSMKKSHVHIRTVHRTLQEIQLKYFKTKKKIT